MPGGGDTRETEALESTTELYVAWLAARDEDQSVDPDGWLEHHVPTEHHDELRELIALGDAALPETIDLHSGRVLGGDFQLLELLGTGGFAWVWKARQLSLDRAVALKVLRADALTNTDPQS